MTASAVELVRSTQQARSLSAAPQPKPARSFDDILSAQRKPVAEPKPEPRADTAKPAQKKSEPKPVDQARPVDESQDVPDDEVTDAAETEAAESSQAKPTKKPQGKGDKADATAIDAVDDSADAEASTEAATPVCPTGLPAVDGEAELVDDGDGVTESVEDKPAAAEKQDGDPDATAAALAAAQQQQPVAASTPTETPSATANGDPAATEATAAVSGTAQATPSNEAATKASSTTTPAEAETPVETDGVTDAKPKLKAHTEEPAEGDVDAASAASQVFVPTDADKAKASEKSAAKEGLDVSALQPVASHEKPAAAHTAMPAVQSSEAPVQPRTVAEENVDRIVTSVRGEMQKGGGTMEIRLDPPTLGQVQVQISVDDTGVLSAQLQTSNEEATRLLSHNLQQLKSTLESAGVMVDKIQVKQAAPADQSSSNSQSGQGDGRQSGQSFEDQSARQEQQRREMLQRMWAKLAGTGEPLDLVA